MKNLALSAEQVEKNIEELHARRDKVADLRIDIEYKLDNEKNKFMQEILIKIANDLTNKESEIEQEIKYTERTLENYNEDRKEQLRNKIKGAVV